MYTDCSLRNTGFIQPLMLQMGNLNPQVKQGLKLMFFFVMILIVKYNVQ